MKTKYLYITILLFFLCSSSFGQSWMHRKYEFYYGIGALNFMGDVGQVPANRIWVVIPENIAPTLNAGLKYNYSGRHYFTGSLFMGQMYAKDHEKGGYAPDRKAESNSFFTELAVRYDFMIGKERPKRTVYKKLGESNLKNFNFPLYLFAGTGGVFNVGTISSPSGKYLLTDNYVNIAPVFFIGFGFRKKISNLNYFTIEANYRVALSDGLDGAKGKEKTIYGKWYDEYQTITINYTHKLRSKRNGMPQFKKR